MKKRKIYNLQFTTYNRKNGFTLVEALVATAIFAIAMTAIVGVFLAIIRINERGRQVRLVEQNARYITEFISRELRNGKINYPAYGVSVPSPYASVLYFINKDEIPASIQLSGSELTLTLNSSPGTPFQLTSTGIEVTNLRFYIEPLTDTEFGPSFEQPKVSMILEMQSQNIRDQARIHLQTSISSRYYPR